MFRTNVPVVKDQFFDRTHELKQLEDLVQSLIDGSPKWFAILGLRKIGKTSLVFELARKTYASQIRFLILDAMSDTPVTTSFFRRYALRAVEATFSDEISVSLRQLFADPDEYRSAIVGTNRFSTLTTSLRQAVLQLPTLRLDKEGIRVCLELPEALAVNHGIRFVVAIDEFQELGTLKAKRGGFDPFPLIRSVWQTHQNIAYIVSGSGRSMLTQMIADKAGPFFQHFSVLELGPMPESDAQALLIGLSPNDRQIPPLLAKHIVQLIGTHPFYLQLLGEALTSCPPPYDDSAFKSVLQEQLFSRTGRLSLYFHREFDRLVGRSSHLAATLQALSEGPQRVSDIAHQIGIASGSAVQYLNRLKDIVRRRDDGLYELEDPIYGMWLKWRTPGGSVVPMTVVGDEAERQVAHHLARMGFELVYQSRGSRGAFDLLAIREANQLGVQVKRSALPLRFDLASWQRMVGDAKRFGWKWIVVSIDNDQTITLLDPAKARKAKEVRLTESATIENLPLWLRHHRRR